MQNGGDLVGGPMSVGSAATGTATVTGVGSAMVATSLQLGSFASGTLNISSGGRVESTSGSVGRFPDAVGTVNIDGAGSRLDEFGMVYVGESGPGVLNISNGGRAQVSVMIAGDREVSPGTINISSAGELISQGACVVGVGWAWHPERPQRRADSELGGRRRRRQHAGHGHHRWCRIPKSGPLGADDGSWIASGDGSLTITGGGEVTSTDGILAQSMGSTGLATVSGTGSRWTLSGDLAIEGVVAITAGGAVRCIDRCIADLFGRVASVNVSGAWARDGPSWAICPSEEILKTERPAASARLPSVRAGPWSRNRIDPFPGATVVAAGR